jgi:hypothetical protein
VEIANLASDGSSTDHASVQLQQTIAAQAVQLAYDTVSKMQKSDRVDYVCKKIDEFRRNGMCSEEIRKFMISVALTNAQFGAVVEYESKLREFTEHPKPEMQIESEHDLSMCRSDTATRKLVQIAKLLREIVVYELRQYDTGATFNPVKMLGVKIDTSYYNKLAADGMVTDLPANGWHYTSFLIVARVHVSGKKNEVVIDGRICNDFVNLCAYDEFMIPDPCNIGRVRMHRRQLAYESIQPRVTNDYMNSAMLNFVIRLLSTLESTDRSPYVTTENSTPRTLHSRTASAYQIGNGSSSTFPS